MVTLSLIYAPSADFTIIDPDIIRCVNLSPQYAGAGDARITGNHRSAERNSILVVNPAISFLC